MPHASSVTRARSVWPAIGVGHEACYNTAACTVVYVSSSVLLLSAAVFVTPVAGAPQPDPRARLVKFLDAAAAEGFTGVVLVTRRSGLRESTAGETIPWGRKGRLQ